MARAIRCAGAVQSGLGERIKWPDLHGVNTVINVREAKTHLSRLLERTHAGEEVIIGKLYVRLVPLKRPAKRRLGFIDGTLDKLLSSRCRRANLTRGRSQRNSGSDGYPV